MVCQCSRHSAASRRKQEQGRHIDNGDFEKAFGSKAVQFFGNSFPLPKRTVDGSRIWSFSGPSNTMV